MGGGVWHPDPSWLKAFRDRVVDDYEGFQEIVEAPGFRDTFGTVGDDGESLKRVPPGYHGGHWKVFHVSFNVTPYLLTSEAAVQAAATAGDVTVTRSPAEDFLCPIQP